MASILRFVPFDAAFDPDTIAVMAAVFDRACAQLQLDPDDPLREAFASKIIGLAAMGERDPDVLYDQTLAGPLPWRKRSE